MMFVCTLDIILVLDGYILTILALMKHFVWLNGEYLVRLLADFCPGPQQICFTKIWILVAPHLLLLRLKGFQSQMYSTFSGMTTGRIWGPLQSPISGLTSVYCVTPEQLSLKSFLMSHTSSAISEKLRHILLCNKCRFCCAVTKCLYLFERMTV